jgi:hypothetical protein
MAQEELTPEQKKEIRLANLARGRQAYFERRKERSELRRKEEEMKLADKQKKLSERMQKVKDYEDSKKQEAQVDKPVTELHKEKRKKVIKVQVSDSESEATASDSDSSVEVIVKRKPKKVVVKKTTKPTVMQPKEPSTGQLSAEIAKQLLKDKLMQQAQESAMRSLFPYHNF